MKSILDLKPINSMPAPTIRWRCRELPRYGGVLVYPSIMVFAKTLEDAERIAARYFRVSIESVSARYDATIAAFGNAANGNRQQWNPRR